MAYFHKFFKRLALYVSYESRTTLPFKQMSVTSLASLYSSYLVGPSFNGVHSINIYLTDVLTENNYILEQGGFLDFYQLFDFKLFLNLTSEERQRYLLTSIQQAVNKLTQQKGWDITRFEDAYQACLMNNLSIDII